MPHINDAGLKLVKDFEGRYLHAYQDSVGVWTIGWGHTGHDVHPGDTITEAVAESLLKEDMTDSEMHVQLFCNKFGVTLNPNQFSALVSLVFNVGPGCLQATRLASALRSHDWQTAADDILAWDHAGGHVLRGLTRRREAERALFLQH